MLRSVSHWSDLRKGTNDLFVNGGYEFANRLHGNLLVQEESPSDKDD